MGLLEALPETDKRRGVLLNSRVVAGRGQAEAYKARVESGAM